jgi:hypothetical protein
MPRYIKDFLQQVKEGAGFIDDIWIERLIKLPASDGEGSVASSLSGRQISNFTQMLEDDIKHTFDEGYFTFRFVAASPGSGKTALLSYLHELIKTNNSYNQSVVLQFQLSDIPMGGISQSFIDKLYSHILADTFWQLLHNDVLSISVKEKAEQVLHDILDKAQIFQLLTTTRIISFRHKFKNYIIKNNVNGFEEIFFSLISEVIDTAPEFAFVYLIDELDALERFSKEIKEVRLLFKELIRKSIQQFKSKIKILIYLVGTSDNLDSFLNEDIVIGSLIRDKIISLNNGYTKEFKQIKVKIDERIKGAYKRHRLFKQAWQEIQKFQFSSHPQTLRDFCKEYATSLLEIHEKYFSKLPERTFEDNVCELIEIECKKIWANYLQQPTYKLSEVSNTTILTGNTFDCYLELLHNDTVVAKAFGQASNYELLGRHLQVLEESLKKVNFQPSSDAPCDLAFLIAPACSSLLRRKLENKKIQFIEYKNQTTEIATNKKININTASKSSLIAAFRGTGVRETTIDKLMDRRRQRKYTDLKDLASDLRFTPAVKTKLQAKLERGEICF